MNHNFGLYWKLLILTGISLITAISGLTGYWLGKNRSQIPRSHQTTSLEKAQSFPLPTSTPRPSPTPSPTLFIRQQSYMMPTNGIILEACSYPWDYNVNTPSPGDKECLEFEANGTVKKKIYSAFLDTLALLTSNYQTPQEQKVKISAELKILYQELTKDKYIQWLKTPKLPIAGAVIPHIKLYSGDLEKQYMVTVYIWGTDSSEEAQRVKAIFEQLQSLSSLTENKH